MRFDFNVYSSLLLPAFLQGGLFALLLLRRGFREDRLADRLLALLLILFSLRVANWMLGFAGWYDAHNAYSTFMFYFPFNHWFAIGPLVYFYFRSLTNREFRLRGTAWWHFAPALLYLLLRGSTFILDVVIAHGWQGKPFPEHFGTKGALADWPQGLLHWALYLSVYVSLGYYLRRTWREYRHYRDYLDANFSETENLRFNWLNYFLYAVGLALLIWAGFEVLELFVDEVSYKLDWYSFFAWGIIIFYLSIAGYGSLPRQVRALHFEPKEALPADTPEPGAENLQVWREKLLDYLRVERPYLNPELTLAELAARLQVSPGLLSRVINVQLGKNFNELINAYRVEAVKRLALDPAVAHLSILGIAYECGFNSKATFNRAFQKHAGCSPSEFIKARKTEKVSKS